MSRKLCLLASALTIALAMPASAKDLKVIGVSVGSMGNPFFVQIVKGAEDGAKAINPNVKVIAGGVDYDLNKQFTQIDNFIAAGADLVLINSVDPNAIEPAMKRLRDAGIVAISVDVSGKGSDATVQTNNVEAGTKACEYIAEKLKGKGNVIIENGPPVSAVIDRVAGCKAVLGKHPDIKILSDNQNAKGSREGGQDVMIGLLTANDKVDAVFAINDPQAIGSEQAAKQLNRTNLFITSVDGAPDIEAALKEKGNLIEASSAQDPYAMAKKAVQVGYDIMNGKKPADPMIQIPSNLVTRDNVGQYKGWSSK
jgi:ribose transport system substrate-binding protein